MKRSKPVKKAATKQASAKKSPAAKKTAPKVGKPSDLSTYILIDRSQSMGPKWEETLSAVNVYVKALPEASKVNIYTFDYSSGFQFDEMRDCTAGKMGNLKSADFMPRGMTPLYDAIGRIVSVAEKGMNKKTVIVVMTDGEENNSREVTKEAAKAALDRCRDRKWQVVFLGADFDAMAQSSSVGVGVANTLNMVTGNYRDAMRGLAVQSSCYGATGQSMSFSDEDRAIASGTRIK